uniref:Uncharacterized protein n=1 Tax=Oryza sativa subsp. japonica TaxID=39947 RepID=Q6EQ56_ORYSJ|nr:hypothetical protein [Oryza sativa Japonica Group]BAD29214.1 hypothetical protein [Oryza sativa Japonica Group]
MAHAAVMLTAAVAWRGGGPSGDGAWPEMAAAARELGCTAPRAVESVGEDSEMGETREGARVRVFMGAGGADVAKTAGDVGWREIERGVGFEIESRPLERARWAGATGRGWRCGEDAGTARRGSGRSGGGGAAAAVAGDGTRLEVVDDPIGGAHMLASRREEEGARAGPRRRWARAGGRVDWADGPRRGKRRKKKKK